MLQALDRRAVLAALLVSTAIAAAAPPLHARVVPEETPSPADESLPGYRGVLELEGDHIHNVGNVLLHVTNFGLLGTALGVRYPFENAPSLRWPAGSRTEHLWAAGLWVGAVLNAEKHVSTGIAPTASLDREFRPGPSDLDQIYETRELALGGSRLPAASADDDRDGLVDEDHLDGRDNDGDGSIDEDFAAVSNQMFVCEYGDFDPAIQARHPDHVPLQILVRQSSMAWDDPLVDDFIAFDFQIVNVGTGPLEDVYIGFFSDFDIGPRSLQMVAQDDQAGFWEGIVPVLLGETVKNVKVSIGYMWDSDTDAGESPGFAGLMFLGAQDPQSISGGTVPLHNFRMFSGTAPFASGGDPTNDAEIYSVLDGTAPQSLPPVDAATGLRPAQRSRAPRDYRVAVSAGPFDVVDAGDTLGFQAAFVVGRGFDGMLKNAVQAQLTFDGVWLDCDVDPTTGIDGRETPICGPDHEGQLVRLDPCNADCDIAVPSDPDCYAVVPRDGCVWWNADCEVEQQTGFVTGDDGAECRIPWLISAAPPPPNMRLAAYEDRVEVLWDNRSQTVPDLRLNAFDFESYRIWRSDNWRRPLGSNARTGPSPDAWMLVAEFDVADNGIGDDSGLKSIRYQPNVPASAVEFYREWFEAHPFLQPPVLAGLSAAEADTARALAQGVRYYRWVDPPFVAGGAVGGPCPADGLCAPMQVGAQVVPARCNSQGRCQQSRPAPHSGAHYFYSVTATDHKLRLNAAQQLVPDGPGLAGDPTSNFVYITPPTNPVERAADSKRIRVVPNPATPQSMEDWKLDPNNDDPTGVKVEFQHLPRSRGRVTIWTLAGDRVQELFFDGTTGNGSLAWNLLSRNGQEVASGLYLYTVEPDDSRFERFVGRFVVIR